MFFFVNLHRLGSLEVDVAKCFSEAGFSLSTDILGCALGSDLLNRRNGLEISILQYRIKGVLVLDFASINGSEMKPYEGITDVCLSIVYDQHLVCFFVRKLFCCLVFARRTGQCIVQALRPQVHWSVR